jgi:hypothetical protein
MSEPERALTTDEQAKAAATNLGRTVLGRDLAPDEAEAMATIFKAAVNALKDGFIRRLAAHVVAERTDESVEEFFEDVITPD